MNSNELLAEGRTRMNCSCTQHAALIAEVGRLQQLIAAQKEHIARLEADLFGAAK